MATPPPHFYTNPSPPFQVYFPFLAKNFVFIVWELQFVTSKPSPVQRHNRNTRIICEIYSKLSIEAWERPSGVFIVNPLSSKPIKWPSTLKQFVGYCWRIVWVWYGHFVVLACKGLTLKTFHTNSWCFSGLLCTGKCLQGED